MKGDRSVLKRTMVRLLGWKVKIEWVQDSQATDLYRYELYYVIGVRACPYNQGTAPLLILSDNRQAHPHPYPPPCPIQQEIVRSQAEHQRNPS